MLGAAEIVPVLEGRWKGNGGHCHEAGGAGRSCWGWREADYPRLARRIEASRKATS